MLNQKLSQGHVTASFARLAIDFCKYNDLEIPIECNLFSSQDRMPFNVWCDILYKIQSQKNQPGLGLRIAEFIHPSHFGITAYIVLSNKTIFDAIPDFIKYVRLAYDFNSMFFEIKNGMFEISWVDSIALPGLLVVETLIGSLIKLGRNYISPHSIPLESIKFIYPPPSNAKEYEKFFQCPVYFNSLTTSITLSLQKIQDLPLPSYDATLKNILLSYADILLERTPKHDQFEQLVHQHIIHGLKMKNLNINLIAQRMGMPLSDFREKLNKNGYKFHDIVSQVKLNLVEQYLRNPTLSINEIADMLGYSEQSAFQRAFKQWTGITPLKWRAKLLAKENSHFSSDQLQLLTYNQNHHKLN